MSALSFAKQRWFTVDTRTLGLFRIGFGLLLLGNLIERMGGHSLVAFYTNDGVWPNHYALFLPPTEGFWSLLLPWSHQSEVRVAFWVIFLVYSLYTLGWKTRLMQVLALICLESINFRYLLVQHGGDVVLNIVAVWSLFLPLGARFSLDAVIKTMREVNEPDVATLNSRPAAPKPEVHVGLAYGFICLNFAIIYFFNTVQKNGISWHSGVAVHDLVWVNRLATPLAVWLRTNGLEYVSPLASWGTLVVEGVLPLLILSPFAQKWLRPLAIVLIVGLHGGIAMLSVLGPFSYVMMAFSLLLVPPEWWAWREGRVAKGDRLDVPIDFTQPGQRFWARIASRLDGGGRLKFVQTDGAEGSGLLAQRVMQHLPGWRFVAFLPLLPGVMRLGRWIAEVGGEALAPRPPAPRVELFEKVKRAAVVVLPVLILIAVFSQVLMENRIVPASIKPATRPQWMTSIIQYLQIPQGWSMFAPETPKSDYRLIVDATLADGSHVDVLTGAPPDFDAALHAPWGMDQQWCETHGRLAHQRQHWRNLRDYLRRRPVLLGWPKEKHVVALEVWKLSYDFPPLGGRAPLNVRRERLFGDEPL